MADYRVIQHINQVMCDRIQEICDGLELNWVGIHKDLDTAPKDDEEATVYCALYRVDDMDDINLPGWPVRQEVMGQTGPQPPDQRRQELRARQADVSGRAPLADRAHPPPVCRIIVFAAKDGVQHPPAFSVPPPPRKRCAGTEHQVPDLVELQHAASQR